MWLAACVLFYTYSECVRVSVCPACQFPPKLSLLLTLVGLFTPRLPDHQLACSVSAALTTPGITNNKTNSTLLPVLFSSEGNCWQLSLQVWYYWDVNEIICQDRKMSSMNVHCALQERFPMVKITTQLENNCPQFLNMLNRVCEKFDSTGRSKACCCSS